MGKYLFHATYGPESVAGLLNDERGGTRRSEVVKNLIEGAGGTLQAFYFGFGETDAYTIADLPDDATAVAFSLAAAASSMMVLKTTVLVTPETVDQAIATKVRFRTPGA